MREIRLFGSEGGVADNGHPYLYRTKSNRNETAIRPVLPGARPKSYR